MSSLIRNEITKILKKKSLYIMLIVILIYIIFANAMYKYSYSIVTQDSYYSESYIEMLENEIKDLNPDKPEDLEQYIGNKTEIDTYNLLKQYDQNSWQYEIIQEKGSSYLAQINHYTYKEKNAEILEQVKTEYNKFLDKLKSNNWKEFAKEELETLKQEKDISGKDIMIDLQIEDLQMRLDYNIEYGNNYKNKALSKYSQSKMQIQELEQNNNKTYREKLAYQKAKEDLAKSKYAIENDKDIFNNADARGILLNLFSEYELFIIITIVLIAGAIVSEEFNKGTIKLLLVRPYSRAKILFAKFIVVILTVIFIIIAVGAIQSVVGGIFFGFDSLKIPAIEYDNNTGKIIEMSVLKNVILNALGKLSIYILLGTLAFALSTLFNNTAVAITISLLGYMASSMVNQFAYYYNIKWLKYFVTPNWDLTQFFYGELPMFEGLNTAFSLVICLVYFAIMMIPTFIVFRKKNIKNI